MEKISEVSDVLHSFGGLSEGSIVALVALGAFALVGFALWIALQMLKSGRQ